MIAKNILLPTLLAAGFALPALAATSSTPDAASSQGSQSQSSQSAQASAAMPTGPQISARLRKSLVDAGFTDIRIMPQSFLVHAKDKDGDPVMMVVNPDSITTVTAMSNSGNAGTAASHSGASSSGTGTKGTQPKTTSD